MNWKKYRKLGADVSSSPRQAKFVAKYESKNKTELIWAIVFNDPINNINCTRNQEKSTAAIGFPRQTPLQTNCSIEPKKMFFIKIKILSNNKYEWNIKIDNIQ